MKAMLSFCIRSIFSVIFTFFLLLSSFASSFAEIKNANEYQDMIIGRDSAKVTVVEYASFTCPHCATFHREVFPKLKEEYLDTGKVKFIYREVYFDAPGLWAGLLARCTANTKSYFGIVDLLYKKQNSWAKGASEKEILNGLFAIGRQLGFEDSRVTECLQNEPKALNLVRSYQEFAKKDGVTSTPSIVINGELYKNVTFDDLKINLDRLLTP